MSPALIRDWAPLITAKRWLATLAKAKWGKCTVKICPRQSPWRCRQCRQPVCNYHVTDADSGRLTGLCPACRRS